MNVSAVSFSLLENAILNLRPISWHTGLRKKYSNIACAYGVTSNGFIGVDTRLVRCRDISYRVTASFTNGHTVFF